MLRQAKRKRPIANCLHCKVGFLAKRRPDGEYTRFCSNSCCRRYHAPARTAECKCCGLIFKCRRTGQHFCSSFCYRDFTIDTAALEQREKDLAQKIKQFQREIHEESELLDRELQRKRFFVKSPDGTCDWCGANLSSRQTRFCSDRCNHHLKKHRRRGYEQHGKVDRKAVFARDGWCCVYCGVAVQEPYDPRVDTSATVDHVIPLAKGGSHSDENCVTACKRCNTRKSDSLEYAVAQEV